MLDVDAQITRLDREGVALADAVGQLEAPVPPCPGWNVRDLVRHIGDVHRWAGSVVRDRIQDRPHRSVSAPADTDLLDWYRDGLAALVDSLRRGSTGDSFWFWGPAPSALAFWARRQANETAVHRRDAESAYGALTPVPAHEAADGLDELLNLVPGRCAAPAGGGRTLHLHATDTAGEWLVRLGDSLEVSSGHHKADCAIRASASDLFLWAMNRRGPAGLDVIGDDSLLRVWSDSIRF